MPDGLRAAAIASMQAGAGPAYDVSTVAGGRLRAENVAQGFVTEMDAASVRIEAAGGAEAGTRVAFALSGFGCEGELKEPAAAAPIGVGNR